MKGILFVEGGGHFLLLWIDHKARVQVLFHPAGISFSGSLCSGLLGVSTELPARYMSQDNFFFFPEDFFFPFVWESVQVCQKANIVLRPMFGEN